jgi:hypothetical protein
LAPDAPAAALREFDLPAEAFESPRKRFLLYLKFLSLKIFLPSSSSPFSAVSSSS